MRTEQNRYPIHYLALGLLVLAAQWVTLPLLGAAQEAEAAVEATDEAEAKVEEDQPKDSPSDKPQDSEAATKDNSKPAEDKSEGSTAQETSEQKSESADQQPAENEDSKKETTEMKSSDNQAESSDATATVETEREVEVEPSKVESSTKPPVPPTQTKPPKKKKCIIGATATLLEKQSGLQFRARVDSGAKSCSLHVEEIRIENESKKENIIERMTENIGKVIHFEIKNGDDKTHILTSKIAGYVIIKTSDKKEGKRRYKVPLTFRWKSMEKEVLVTLNNRNHMEYPLLLGRNFLRGDFLVDVELNSDD